MFVAKSSSALSKLMPLNNKQAFPVLFMSDGSYFTVLTWSSYHALFVACGVRRVFERTMQNINADYKKETAIRTEERLLFASHVEP